MTALREQRAAAPVSYDGRAAAAQRDTLGRMAASERQPALRRRLSHTCEESARKRLRPAKRRTGPYPDPLPAAPGGSRGPAARSSVAGSGSGRQRSGPAVAAVVPPRGGVRGPGPRHESPARHVRRRPHEAVEAGSGRVSLRGRDGAVPGGPLPAERGRRARSVRDSITGAGLRAPGRNALRCSRQPPEMSVKARKADKEGRVTGCRWDLRGQE